MNYAFDIDGTLTKHPDSFRGIMRSLKNNGHKVYVLTGSIDAPGSLTSNEEWRKEQLKSIGITEDDYSDLAICWAPGDYEEVGRMKSVFCRDFEVAMIFEDSGVFIQCIKQWSPTTATMGVV